MKTGSVIGLRTETFCSYCGVHLNVRGYKVRKRNYCSRECRRKAKEHKRYVKVGFNSDTLNLPENRYFCYKCGEIYYRKYKPNVKEYTFCSQECCNSYFVGRKRVDYKGSADETKRRIRRSYWLKLRNRVLRRDSGACLMCNDNKGLNVHHIEPYRINKNDKLSNLITLCCRCHGNIEPKWYLLAGQNG